MGKSSAKRPPFLFTQINGPTFDKDSLNGDFLTIGNLTIGAANQSGENQLFANNDDKTMTLAMFGYISNIEQIKTKYDIPIENPANFLFKLYSKMGHSFFPELDGVFTIMLFDHFREKLFIFQDKYGSNLPLYYSFKDSLFCASISLDILLQKTGQKRELDIVSARQLFIHKIVPNKATLIKDVKKLVPNQLLIFYVKQKKLSLKHLARHRANLPLINLSTTELLPAIRKEIETLTALSGKKDMVALSLSSGFDSNLMLHFLSKLSPRKITALTIGGREINEIPTARRIASFYPNLEHLCHSIQDSEISSLRDLARVTEGYVFDSSLFLQLQLGRIFCEKNIHSVFAADGADQQIDPYRNTGLGKFYRYWLDLKNRLRHYLFHEPFGNWPAIFLGKRPSVFAEQNLRKRFVRSVKRRFFLSRPDPGYYVELDYILKKNGLVLSSFGINVFYPFLGKRTFDLCSSFGRLNHDKKIYRCLVREEIGSPIAECLEKVGGTTDTFYLMKGDDERWQQLLASNLAKKVLSKSQLNLLAKNKKALHEYILCLAYLKEFCEVFEVFF